MGFGESGDFARAKSPLSLLIFHYHCYLKYVYTVEWRKGRGVEKLLENISRKIKTNIDGYPGHYI